MLELSSTLYYLTSVKNSIQYDTGFSELSIDIINMFNHAELSRLEKLKFNKINLLNEIYNICKFKYPNTTPSNSASQIKHIPEILNIELANTSGYTDIAKKFKENYLDKFTQQNRYNTILTSSSNDREFQNLNMACRIINNVGWASSSLLTPPATFIAAIIASVFYIVNYYEDKDSTNIKNTNIGAEIFKIPLFSLCLFIIFLGLTYNNYLSRYKIAAAKVEKHTDLLISLIEQRLKLIKEISELRKKLTNNDKLYQNSRGNNPIKSFFERVKSLSNYNFIKLPNLKNIDKNHCSRDYLNIPWQLAGQIEDICNDFVNHSNDFVDHAGSSHTLEHKPLRRRRGSW